MSLIVVGIVWWMFGMVQSQDSVLLKDLQWKNRVVLYFPGEAATWEEPSNAQISALKERKVLYWVYGDVSISNAGKSLHPSEWERMKRAYVPKSNKDLWLLIGLDGGVKAVDQSNLDWSTIFKLIDGMPMRRSEIRNGS
ncbi:DUF4174 domain-containing protein [Mongoliitalea daihaiensis]|uniref:DUF4174 domain-containing protein n=1 Tax=Mongoliitalea daihaiensis TaxID=2782006 RepID=UPI001F26017D|nr:DUF4174 domain-containing protein [Mongoliitalea daihaiensis]UJP63437.1 DUF4174 domain-containing protein [Mongoliitalea daihaiensis]